MFFNEPQIISCDIKENILQLHTKKKFNYNVTCKRNSNVPKGDIILTSLNEIFKQHQRKIF